MYLIPAPAKLEKKEGRFIWAYDRYVTVDQSCSQLVTRQASLFCDGAEKELGYRPLLTRGAAKAGDVVFKQDDTMKAQSYVLDIAEDAIVLTGDEAGLWHGMQTLLQIIEQEGACLSALHIEDAPAIVNRGYYFDCTRGRIPKLSWLKQLADRMAYYKLNQLQLYVEHSYLFRGMTELWRDDTPLTAEEIMEFDRYCAERGIELVPSLSSFGHLYKLLCSREYSHLCELEDSEGNPFSQTGRMAHHTINTSDPESLQLIEGMISEYMELFTSRQFNLCADETFDLGRGRNKEAVEKLPKEPDFDCVMGDWYWRKGQHEKAVQMYELAIAKLETYGTVNRGIITTSMLIQMYECLGEGCRRLGDYQKAVRYCVIVLNTDHKDMDALLTLINCFTEKNVSAEEIVQFLGKIYDYSDIKDKVILLRVAMAMGRKDLERMFRGILLPQEREEFDAAMETAQSGAPLS